MLKSLMILSLIFGSLLQAATPQPPSGGIGQGPQPTSSQPTPTAVGCEVKAGCGLDAPSAQPTTSPLVYVGGGLALTLVAGGGIWMAVSRRKSREKPDETPKEED